MSSASSRRWQGWGAFACAVATVAAVACGGHATSSDGAQSSPNDSPNNSTGVASESVGSILSVTSDALVGPLAPNMPLAISYHAPPTYRAFEVDLATSATVDAWIVPTSGTALAFLTDGSFTVLATNSDASAGTSAHITSASALAAGKYFVVMREASEQDTTFNVSWTTLDATAGITCSGSIAGVPETDSNVSVWRTGPSGGIYTLSVSSNLLRVFMNEPGIPGDPATLSAYSPLTFSLAEGGGFTIVGTTVTANLHASRELAPYTILVNCTGTTTLHDEDGSVLDGGVPPMPFDAGISGDSSIDGTSDANAADDASDGTIVDSDGSSDDGGDASTCIGTPHVNYMGPRAFADVTLPPNTFGVIGTSQAAVLQYTETVELTLWLNHDVVGDNPNFPTLALYSGCDLSGSKLLDIEGAASNSVLLAPGYYLLVSSNVTGGGLFAEPPPPPPTNTTCATAIVAPASDGPGGEVPNRVYDSLPRYFEFSTMDTLTQQYLYVWNYAQASLMETIGFEVEVQTTCDDSSSDIVNSPADPDFIFDSPGAYCNGAPPPFTPSSGCGVSLGGAGGGTLTFTKGTKYWLKFTSIELGTQIGYTVHSD